jgi:hypothetical protein
MRARTAIVLGAAGALFIYWLAVQPRYAGGDTLCLRSELTASDGQTTLAPGRYQVSDAEGPPWILRMLTYDLHSGTYNVFSIDAEGAAIGGNTHVHLGSLEAASHRQNPKYQCP